MEIERISNNLYDQKGQYRKYSRTRNKKNTASHSQPLDAVVFDIENSKNYELQKQQDRLMLKAYINTLPDEYVYKRMRRFKNSFNEIDSALIDKLIMEAI